MPMRPHPTHAQLEILRVLWTRGPSTVRQVNEVLSDGRDIGYTTTLKLMQIMSEEGLVSRDESSRTHVYAARLTERQAQRQLVTDLVDRAFGGSAAALVLHALSAHPASPSELEDMRRAVNEYRAAHLADAPSAKAGRKSKGGQS